MKPVTVSHHVKAPPERVFASASNFPNAPNLIPGIVKVEMLTQPPWGVGTKFRESRMMFGKEHAETMEIVAWDPPRLYALGCQSCGFTMRSDLRFIPEDGGTRIEMSTGCTPQTFMAKLFSPIGALTSGWAKKSFAKDLAAMAAAVERGAG